MEVQSTFQIEVPSETNPFTPSNLLQTLTQASSSTPAQIQTGTKQLQHWSTEPYYHATLQSIFLERIQLPPRIRHMAVIQLKNGIDKYWRKTAANTLTKDEKSLIRSRCLECCVQEPEHRLAVQFSVVIAKVVRMDFPHDWPDAFEPLLGVLGSEGSDRQQWNNQHDLATRERLLPRVLLVLLFSIKELAAGRLARMQSNLRKVAPEMFRGLMSVYVRTSKVWIERFQRGGIAAVKGDDEIGSQMSTSLLALRTLRRLAIAGFEFPNRHQEVRDFWTLLQGQFGEIIPQVTTSSSQGNSTGERIRRIHDIVERHLLQMSKLHLNMAKTHPASFVLLPDSLNLATGYWGLLVSVGQTRGVHVAGKEAETSDDDQDSCLEKLTLKGMNILRACVSMVYNGILVFKMSQAEDREERRTAIEIMKTNLLSDDKLREMMETLVIRYFVYTPKDLHKWEQEPEAYEFSQSDNDAWEYSIRCCAEKLFLDLVINNKDILTPALLGVFRSVATLDNQDVFLKDSIYTAIAIAVPAIIDQVDVQTLCSQLFVPEVLIRKPEYKILRRRIAILVGELIPPSETEERTLVYQIFQYLLDKNDSLNDMVVRITAGRYLRNLIDPFKFQSEQFLPYAPTILSRTMELIGEAEMGETKLSLLQSVNQIAERLDMDIISVADQLISMLPPIWEQASQEFLVRQAILTLLTIMTNSLRAESAKYHPLLLPIIHSSVAVGSESRTYLIEEALELWSALVIQSPQVTSQDLLTLTDNLYPIIEGSEDTLTKALEITESYILIAPAFMLTNSGRLLTLFSALIDRSKKREIHGRVTKLVELLILASLENSDTGIQNLTDALIQSSFASILLRGLLSAYLSHQATGPNRPSTHIDGIIETDHLSILARILLASPQHFFTILQSAPTPPTASSPLISALTAKLPPSSSPLLQTLDWLLTEWFSHSPNIGAPTRKKLHCLALTNLFSLAAESSSPPEFPGLLLGRLQEYMTFWTDTILDVCDIEADDLRIYGDDGDRACFGDGVVNGNGNAAPNINSTTFGGGNSTHGDGSGNKSRVGNDLLIYSDPYSGKVEGESAETERRRAVDFRDPVHRMDSARFVAGVLGKVVGELGGGDVFQREWVGNVDAEVVRGFGGMGLV